MRYTLEDEGGNLLLKFALLPCPENLSEFLTILIETMAVSKVVNTLELADCQQYELQDGRFFFLKALCDIQ